MNASDTIAVVNQVLEAISANGSNNTGIVGQVLEILSYVNSIIVGGIALLGVIGKMDKSNTVSKGLERLIQALHTKEELPVELKDGKFELKEESEESSQS